MFFTEIETDFPAKIGNSNVFLFFQSKNRCSLPKLRLIFRPRSEILTLFQAESRHVFHNFGTQFPLGGLFSIFHQKSASKAPKTCDFAYFTSQWGGLEPLPPPLATLLNCSHTKSEDKFLFMQKFILMPCPPHFRLVASALRLLWRQH